MNEDFRFDLHFSTVGGTGGIADTCGLYRTLKIPVAVIADLDMIVDDDKISRVLERLIDDEHARTELLQQCRQIAETVKNLPPTVSAQDLRAGLDGIAAHSMDWEHRDDVQIRTRLRQLAAQLDRMRRLKRGGVCAFEGELREHLSSTVTALRGFGLFLVPVGELEEWLSNHYVGVSKSDKRAWSNAAAHVIQNAGKRQGDVWSFVAGVGSYLSVSSSAGASTIGPVA